MSLELEHNTASGQLPTGTIPTTHELTSVPELDRIPPAAPVYVTSQYAHIIAAYQDIND